MNTNQNRRRRMLAVTIGLAAASLAPGVLAQAAKPAAGAQAELDALVKGAKAEGEVTLYTTTPDTQAKRIIEAFTGKHGIKVQYLRLGSTPLQQRWAAEALAGTFAADIMFNAGDAASFAEEGMKKGWVEPISQAGIPVLKSGEFPARFNRGSVAVVQITPWLIGYNTEKLKGADVPKDWKDALNPKLKGQIILPDPRVSDAYLDIWALLLDRYGESYLTQFRAQNPRLVTAGAAGSQSLGAGEGTIMMPTTIANIMTVKAKGAPVNMFAPDLTTGVEIQVMLTARGKSRHPNAARLLANYVLSAEGNKVFNDEPGGVTMYDPKGLPKQYQAPKAGTTARKAEILKLLGL